MVLIHTPSLSIHCIEIRKVHLKEQLPKIEQVLRQSKGPLQQLLEALSPLVLHNCMPGTHGNLVLILT